MINKLECKGYISKFNIMDNMASATIKTFLDSKNISIELVEPHNHQLSAAERDIQTFKNHFLLAYLPPIVNSSTTMAQVTSPGTRFAKDSSNIKT